MMIEKARLTGVHPSRSRAIRYGNQATAVAVASRPGEEAYTQSKQVLQIVTNSFQELGFALGDVVHVTIYLQDMADKAEFNRAWEEWVSRSAPPVRCCIGAALEQGYRVEVLAHAAR